MSYIGDYPIESTIHTKFTTRAFATGIPTTLAGTPSLRIYAGDSVNEITAGITLTTDFDGVTGLNHVTIVATSPNGYPGGFNYQVVIAAGTVDGVSVVGEVVAEFSIYRTSALRPTVAGRTLDVSAAGHVETVDTCTTNTDMRGTDNASTHSAADVWSVPTRDVTNMRGTDNASTHSAADVWTSTTRTLTDKTGFGIDWGATTNQAAAVTLTGTTVATVSTLTGHTPQTGDNYTRLGAPTGASISADIANVPANQDAAVVEGSITTLQQKRLTLSALAGKLSGAATTTISIRDTTDMKDRIVATVDADGNRSAVTLNGT